MSSYSVGNSVPAFRVSESFCFIEANCSIQSGSATTVSGNDRLFVLSGFASMLLGARGVDSSVSPCYCCVCWRETRSVSCQRFACHLIGRIADSDSAGPGSSPGGRAEKHTRSRVGATLFLSLALCLSGLRERTATPCTPVRVRPGSPAQQARAAVLPVW